MLPQSNDSTLHRLPTSMTTDAGLALGDIQTTLNYYSPDSSGEAPYQYYGMSPPPGKSQFNSLNDPRDAVIHNARGREDTFSLDVSGFEFLKHTSRETEFLDEDAIKTDYYAEIEALLKKHTGAKRVHIYAHTIRRDYEGRVGENVRRPSNRVHVDSTFEDGFASVRLYLGDDAERLLKSRVRIINVWRPIKTPVHHYPLALADWRTVSVENDLVPIRFIFPNIEHTVYNVRYNENLKWYYLKEQMPSEVTLIKCFDSCTDGRARLSPHTAFRDAGSLPDAPMRQSIEVRALVFDEE